ncbi:MAG TPA: BlaI/MecI/CopY family transcriptional regulator, partial [Pseudonocardiaceae bacterium]
MSKYTAGESPRRRAHGELETEVLGSVATAQEPVTISEVQAALGMGLAYTTVHTILTRLVEKGLVERIRSGRGHTYQPAHMAAQLVAQQMQT